MKRKKIIIPILFITACTLSFARAPLPESATEGTRGFITDKVADTIDLVQTSVHSLHAGFADVQIQAKDTISQIQTGIKNLPGALYNAFPRYTVQALGGLMALAGWNWCKSGINNLQEYWMPLKPKPRLNDSQKRKLKRSKSGSNLSKQKEKKSKNEFNPLRHNLNENSVDYQKKMQDYYRSRRNRGGLELIIGTLSMGAGLYIACNPEVTIRYFTSNTPQNVSNRK